MIASQFITISSSVLPDLERILHLYRNDLFATECRLLGSGGSGDVYLFDGLLRKYVIKIYHRVPKNDEAEILTELQGIPCVPRLFGYIPNKFLIMEYIDGQTLDNPLRYTPKRLWKHSVDTFLLNIKEKGYVPFDLKLDNIMLDWKGTIWFVDVGAFEKVSRKDFSFYFERLKSDLLYDLDTCFTVNK